MPSPKKREGLLTKAIYFLLGAVALVLFSNDLTGAFLPALRPSTSDFSEIFASSWLWRQGQNPYDPALAEAARQHIVGASGEIFLVNVPTAFVLMAPFTFLPWGWANLTLLILGAASLAMSVFLILRERGHTSWGLGTVSALVFILSFSPLRIAFQWGNIVLLVLPLSVFAIIFAECNCDLAAGLLLGLAICLKPQIGIWIGLYYLIRTRCKIILSSIAVCLATSALFFLHPIPYRSLMACYQSNLQHWFAPGRPYASIDGWPMYSLRMQGVFYQITHSGSASIWMAQVLFVSGVAAWGILVLRYGDRIPAALAVVSIMSLSFLSLYHSTPDISILLLSLGDAVPSSLRRWTATQKLICVSLFLLMLPERSIFEFLYHHLNRSFTDSWWWEVCVVRYLPWLLLALGSLLLSRIYEIQLGKRWRGRDQ